MNIYLALTDLELYHYHREHAPEEINFWRQNKRIFRSLDVEEPLCFVSKMRKGQPRMVMGAGFFMEASRQTLHQAWDTYGTQNGVPTRDDFLRKVTRRKWEAGKTPDIDPEIGCILLTDPVFFPEEDWFEVPADLSPRVVAGKLYRTDTETGEQLRVQLYERIHRYWAGREVTEEVSVQERESYSAGTRPNIRKGAQSFRSAVKRAYRGRCAVTGERIGPLLEAAHIRPWAKDGPNVTSNGLLLRVDWHRLFDRGYFTISPNLTVTFSPQFQAHFPQASSYLSFEGRPLHLPPAPDQQPHPGFLDWHRKHIFRT